jgi:hypothetical protein
MNITAKELKAMQQRQRRLFDLSNEIQRQASQIDPTDPSSAAGWLVNASIDIHQATTRYARCIELLEVQLGQRKES